MVLLGPASWGAGYRRSRGVCESSRTPSSVRLIHRGSATNMGGGGGDKEMGREPGGFPLSRWASGAPQNLAYLSLTSPDTPGLAGPPRKAEVCPDTGGRAADGHAPRASGALGRDCAASIRDAPN